MFRIIGSFPTSRFDSLPLKMIRNIYSLRNSLNLLWNKDAKIWSVGNLDSFHEMPFCLILGCDQEQNERQLKKEIVNWPNTLEVGCVFPMVVISILPHVTESCGMSHWVMWNESLSHVDQMTIGKTHPSLSSYLEVVLVQFVQAHHFFLVSLDHVVFQRQYPASIKGLLEYFSHLCTCDALYIQSDGIPSTMESHHFYLKLSFFLRKYILKFSPSQFGSAPFSSKSLIIL